MTPVLGCRPLQTRRERQTAYVSRTRFVEEQRCNSQGVCGERSFGRVTNGVDSRRSIALICAGPHNGRG